MNPIVLGSLVSAGGSLLGSIGSQMFNRSNMAEQVAASKELMDYQWKNFNSPAAQISALNQKGLGANAYLGGKGSVGTPSPSMPSSAPISLDGVTDLSGISSYIMSVANAKKAGMDTKLSEQEIKNKEVERQRNEFELNLRKEFGKDIQTAELANAYMYLVLASDTSDLNEQEKRLNDWRIASEKAVSQANEHNRDILKQRLENMPVAINLENRLNEEKIKSEKASQSASYASAEAAHEQANVSRENRRLQAALADIEEDTKSYKIESLISEYQRNGWLSEADANEARLRASRLHSIELRRDNSRLFKATDDLSEWLKSKLKIFGK